MGTYIAELYHDPQMSPRANAAVRAQAKRTGEALPGLMKQKDITMIGDYHLDPEHRAILIFEAPSVEAVRDLLYESGFMHFNNGRIYPASRLSEVRDSAMDAPTII